MQNMSLALHFSASSTSVHNNRTGNYVEDEEHIVPNGDYEIYKDESLKSAYKKLFDDAVKKFNSKQKDKKRRIDDYFSQITKQSKKSRNKNVCYEVVGEIGTLLNRPSAEDCKKILTEYVRGFQERNPNLYVTQAVWHNDEEAKLIDKATGTERWIPSIPHVHIQFIPYCHKEKGLSCHTSFAGALAEMGFGKSRRKSERPFEKWITQERAVISRSCENLGFFIGEPKRERKRHYEPKEYRDLKIEQSRVTYEVQRLKEEKVKAQKEIEALENEKKKVRKELETVKQSVPKSEEQIRKEVSATYENQIAQLKQALLDVYEDKMKSKSFDDIMSFMQANMPQTFDTISSLIPEELVKNKKKSEKELGKTKENNQI